MSDPMITGMPRTAVPNGLIDPVDKARAELKAALAAIEEKGNLPKRAAIASEEAAAKARAFRRRQPVAAAFAVVGAAALVGLAVWGAVTAYTR